MQPGTSACPHELHVAAHNPPFPKHAVPDKFFFKDPDDPTSVRCLTCYFCRLVTRVHGQRHRDKLKAAANEQNALVDKGIGQFMNCSDEIHDGRSGSTYARNAVPIDRFRSRFGDSRSRIVETCIDCRNWRASFATANRKKLKDDATTAGRHLCTTCLKDITDCRVLNCDGSLSESCKECKDQIRKIRLEVKAHYKQIIMDRIRKHGVSCMRCEKLYFRPVDEESFVVRELQTYVRDGSRYAILGSVEFPMSEVLMFCDMLLELDIIELDHLTMEEQLARGIIKQKSEFAPKWKEVSKISNIQDMDFEAVGCQHLCCKCHVIVTIERAKSSNYLTPLAAMKMKHVNTLKLSGCSSCGYKNDRLPKCFDMDHVETKLANISAMVCDENVTLEQFIEECKRCRVLCKFCHKIRTRIQRKAGIRSLKVKPTVVVPEA